MKKFPYARAIDRLLAAHFSADAPGVVVGVSHKGRLVHAAARGCANLRTATPLTATTPFRICSISKQFIAALMWREITTKRIALDAHPSRYLPWFAGADANLQIAHLLQNKSGIRDQWVLAMMMGARAEQRFTLDDGNEVMRRAITSMFVPGSQNLYCNGNFELLGQILAVVSGEDFTHAVRRHILTPLAMHDTFVGDDTAVPLPGNARGYRFHNGAWEEEANAVHWSASAGIVSTVVDLLKWDACLRDPRAAGLPWVEKIKRALPFNDGATATYASGINHLQVNDRATLSHQGALRGWRSVLLRFVREDVGIAVFMNRTNFPTKQAQFPHAIANEVARAMQIAPLTLSSRSMPPLPRRNVNASTPPLGWFVSREQGMLLQLDMADGQLHAHVQGSAVALYASHATHKASDTNAWQSLDANLQLQMMAPDTALITLRDANVVAALTRIGDISSSPASRSSSASSFSPRGTFVCAPLASALHIDGSAPDVHIHFTGIFGDGVGYPLHILDANTVWFAIARGVDEAPPGRVLVIFDAHNRALELSCPLARRMVFRAEAHV